MVVRLAVMAVAASFFHDVEQTLASFGSMFGLSGRTNMLAVVSLLCFLSPSLANRIGSGPDHRPSLQHPSNSLLVFCCESAVEGSLTGPVVIV
jgi:hypothetical protein